MEGQGACCANPCNNRTARESVKFLGLVHGVTPQLVKVFDRALMTQLPHR